MTPIIGKEYPKIVIPLIDAAKKNIDIMVYDWRFYVDRPEHPVSLLNQALVRAVRRGVQVRVLVNAALVVPNLTAVGIKARQLADRRTLHTKLVIIDSSDIIIGSHNFTSNAFTSNLEASVYFPQCDVVERLQTYFNNLYLM